MPLSDKKFPEVIKVNHQHKGASSGTWHTFDTTPGKVYVEGELVHKLIASLEQLASYQYRTGGVPHTVSEEPEYPCMCHDCMQHRARGLLMKAKEIYFK